MKTNRKRGCSLIMTACLVAVTLLVSAGVPGGTGREGGRAFAMDGKEVTPGTVQEEEQPVVFSKASGAYADSFELELGCPDDQAVIYYTTDGSSPADENNEARIAYTGEAIRITDRKADANVLAAIDPILFDAVNVKADSDRKNFVSTIQKPADEAVDKCTVIKAAAQYADGNRSEVVTNTYFVGEMAGHIQGIQESCQAAGMDLSIMSISMDADDLFDSTKGIYVKGDVFDKALEEHLGSGGKLPSGSSAAETCRQLDANYKQKGRAWERETHIDYFESDGTNTACKLQQDCGIRIQGNYSRSDYQKSFRLYARQDYGKKNFKYGFWDTAVNDSGEIIEKYKTIVLRNGGNCAFTAKFADAFWQSLMKGLSCDSQSARPCAVYLNGEYWGIYILQDDFRGSYIENKHGILKEDVVVYKGDAEALRDLGYKLDEGELPAGVTDESYYFKEMEEFMASHKDLSNDADYEEFAKIVDVQSAIDYFAAETWINNKWDWPGKNWSMWKSTKIDESNPYADGKWRFLIYDVEFGGISGSEDAWANTVKNSKLLTIGSSKKGDDNWDKPNVRCFAFLMSNRSFRDAFNQRLTELTSTSFEKENALAVCTRYKDIYHPILDQFFKRFPTKWGNKIRTADMAVNGNNGDTYGTWANIITFLNNRADNISDITTYISDYFHDNEPEVTLPPTQAPDSTQAPAQPVPSPSCGTGEPAVMIEPGDVSLTLSDGTIKTVSVDMHGTVISTRYTVNGITYTLKADKTLCILASNKGKWKKKKSVDIADVVIISGKKYKVTEIAAGAFSGCTKLRQVSVGSNVTIIGKNAFRGCKNLKTISLSTRKLKKVGSRAFTGISKKAAILCPSAKIKAYRKLLTPKTGFAKKSMKIKKN